MEEKINELEKSYKELKEEAIDSINDYRNKYKKLEKETIDSINNYKNKYENIKKNYEEAKTKIIKLEKRNDKIIDKYNSLIDQMNNEE